VRCRADDPEFRRTCRRDFEWSYHVAARLSLLGAHEEAARLADNAIQSRFHRTIRFCICDPFLDNIRGEERFKKLLERAKIRVGAL